MTSSHDESLAKQAAAKAAADLIEEGMIVGLGSGSTSQKFIDELAVRCRNGLKIEAIASSEQIKAYAKQNDIPLIEFDKLIDIDLDVDGADEIDSKKQIIKGGGGALLHEKILASASKEMVVIADSRKLVKTLGTHPVAVEIVPYGFRNTIQRLSEQGYQGSLRLAEGKKPFVTDNNNYIFDIKFSKPIDNPQLHHLNLLNIVGIIETGFFFNIAGRVLIGYPDGSVKILP